jgi:hypothetical protein
MFRAVLLGFVREEIFTSPMELYRRQKTSRITRWKTATRKKERKKEKVRKHEILIRA